MSDQGPRAATKAEKPMRVKKQNQTAPRVGHADTKTAAHTMTPVK